MYLLRIQTEHMDCYLCTKRQIPVIFNFFISRTVIKNKTNKDLKMVIPILLKCRYNLKIRFANEIKIKSQFNND